MLFGFVFVISFFDQICNCLSKQHKLDAIREENLDLPRNHTEKNGLGNGCRLFFNILVYLSWPGCGSCSHMEPPRPARSLGPGRESGSAPPTAAALSTSHTHTTKYNYCQQQTFLLSQKVRFCESCEFSKRKDYSALLWSVCCWICVCRV